MRERRRDAVGEPRVTAGGRRAGVWRSPRTWVAIGTAIVAGSALMVSGSASASTGGNVNAKGVLKYGVDLNDTFSNTFDPAASTDDCSYTEYTGLFDSLLSPSNTKVNPLLAASYTATPTSITFHLQPGATFSNGDPVTAATVQASIEHIKTSPFRFSLTLHPEHPAGQPADDHLHPQQAGRRRRALGHDLHRRDAARPVGPAHHQHRARRLGALHPGQLPAGLIHACSRPTPPTGASRPTSSAAWTSCRYRPAPRRSPPWRPGPSTCCPSSPRTTPR